MLSHNQLKVGGVGFRDNDRGEISADVLVQRREFFLREHKSDQQKTYDNKTGEHTSGQRPLFIQDWQAHLENKE